jgi:hypothetical protein
MSPLRIVMGNSDVLNQDLADILGDFSKYVRHLEKEEADGTTIEIVNPPKLYYICNCNNKGGDF